MDSILDIAYDLSNAIKKHAYYVNYLKALNNIENNYSLKKLLDEYRGKLLEITLKQSAGHTVSDNEVELLEEDFEKIQASPDASDFLNCEEQLLDLLSKVFGIINEDIPLDLDF